MLLMVVLQNRQCIIPNFIFEMFYCSTSNSLYTNFIGYYLFYLLYVHITQTYKE